MPCPSVFMCNNLVVVGKIFQSFCDGLSLVCLAGLCHSVQILINKIVLRRLKVNLTSL